MMNKWLFTVILSAGTACAATAFAGHGPGSGPGRPHGPPGGDLLGHIGHMLHQLELSEAQKESIHAVMRDSRDSLEANRGATMENLHQLHHILSDDSLDEAALEEVARQAGRVAEERVLITGTTVAAILAELTGEQRAELRTLAEQRRERMREHRLRLPDDDSGG